MSPLTQSRWFDFTDVKSKKKDRKAVASVAGKERGTHRDPQVLSTGGSSNSSNSDPFKNLDDLTVPSIPAVTTKSKSVI